MFKLSGFISNITAIKNLKIIMNRKKYQALAIEALGTFASELVLEEVQKIAGINQKQITDGALAQYEYLLENKLEIIKKQSFRNEWSNSRILAKKIAEKDTSTLVDEFAKAKYGLIFIKLPHYKQESIKMLLQDHELKQVIKDVNVNKRFQSTYIDTYITLSARGIDLTSRKKKFMLSVKKVQKDAYRKRRNKRPPQKQIINEFMCLKYYDFNKHKENHNTQLLQSTKYKIILSPKAHNYRKLTHFEIIRDQEINNIYAGIKKIIDGNDQQYETKTTLSDFLGRMSEQENTMYSTFKEIEKKELFHLIRIALSAGQNPVLLGNTYMQQHATDLEMKNLIDQAMVIDKIFAEQDESLNLVKEHMLIQESTAQNIIDEYNYLDQIYNIDGMDIYQLLDTSEKHSLRKSELRKQDDHKETKNFISSVENFLTSEKTLEEIVERRKNIRNEILFHIEEINDYRTNHGFKKYTPKQEALPVYKILTIDSILPA